MVQGPHLNDTVSVLIAEDEANLRKAISAMLRRAGHDVHETSDGKEAYQAAVESSYDVVLTDLLMPVMDGMDLLARLHELDPQIPVIMLTAHGSIATAVEAMKNGAWDFLTKPFEEADLLAAVNKAARSAAANRREVSSNHRHPRGPIMVSRSRSMAEIMATVKRVASSDATVLIMGETGTGKELIARTIHEESPRHKAPFVAVNCAALPEHLIESELFGHEEGAFTGATNQRIGRFELANGGTLFLDEVGDMPSQVQIKLLRAIQERVIERIGGLAPIALDVRFITATNRELKTLISEGRFREDLFYRLNVVPVTLPPLRERPEDIAPLVRHFLEQFSERLGLAAVKQLSDGALDALTRYSWPGNIRELQNLVERMVLLVDGDIIDVKHLPMEMRQSPEGDATLKDSVEMSGARLERALIVEALEKTGGNRTHAARLLRISRKTLQNKLKVHGIP